VRETGPAIDHLGTALVSAFAFALQAKDLPHLAPVAGEIVIEIKTRDDLTPFQATMAFLDLGVGLLGPPINFTTLSPNNKGQRNEQTGEGHR